MKQNRPGGKAAIDVFQRTEKDVSFGSVNDAVIAATLTLPVTEAKCPAVVLVAGSGPMDRNSTFLHHEPFRNIADWLSSKGIAVLRCDKRGIGKSTGDFQTAGMEELVADVLGGVEYLREVPGIDKNRIGLVGHSEGGLVALMAADRCSDIAFIVLMSSPAMPVKENGALFFSLMVNEDKGGIKLFGKDKAEFDRFFDIVTRKAYSPEEREEALGIAGRMLPRMDERSKQVFGIAGLEPEVFITIFGMVPCMQEFLDSNPEYYLQSVKCPVFALYGSKDVQVPSIGNLPVMKKADELNPNVDFRILEVEGMNHLYQRCNTGYPSEYGSTARAMDPEVLSMVSDWILGKSEDGKN